MTAFGAAEEGKTNAEVAEDAEVRRGKAKTNAMCAMVCDVRFRAVVRDGAPEHPANPHLEVPRCGAPGRGASRRD